nr:hypothetical protein [Solirubrobacterales bacterium]
MTLDMSSGIRRKDATPPAQVRRIINGRLVAIGLLARSGFCAAVLTFTLLAAVTPRAQAAALKPPVAQAPAAGASVEALPAFTWGAVPGAAQYEFQQSADPKFSSIVLGK